MTRRLVAALAVAACAFPAAAQGGPKPRKVIVGDDYYAPAKLTVKPGTTVRWTWLEDNGNSHDIKLKKAPKGVKRFHSASAAADYSYSKKLAARGTYRIVCTLHQDMAMTVTVR